MTTSFLSVLTTDATTLTDLVPIEKYYAPSLRDFIRLRRIQYDVTLKVMLNGVPQGRSEASI